MDRSNMVCDSSCDSNNRYDCFSGTRERVEIRFTLEKLA